jgi:predicted ribosomally synthesized peptide with SipW-like signal peptide
MVAKIAIGALITLVATLAYFAAIETTEHKANTNMLAAQHKECTIPVSPEAVPGKGAALFADVIRQMDQVTPVQTLSRTTYTDGKLDQRWVDQRKSGHTLE